MEKEIWTGGVRLDLTNITWPFAKLSVTKEKLEITAFKTKLTFRPDQIERIEPIGRIPFFGKGVQIHHKLDPLTEPSKVIFWHLSKDTSWLVDKLHQWGYGAC